MYNYTLPKIWKARIQRYWDKIMPSDFPASSSVFSLKFESEEVKEAVDTFEQTLPETAPEYVPEGTSMTNYIGTYDVKAEAGEETLLSPEYITEKNIVALHYNSETSTWEHIESAHLVDGYVWGTLDSFSPVAIIGYRKEIHAETPNGALPTGFTYIVCEGNTVKVYEDEEGVHVMNTASGKVIDLTDKSCVVGGSIDGTPMEKTNVAVVGVKNKTICNKIIAGSFYYEEEGSVNMGSAKVVVVDSVMNGITGNCGAIRAEDVLIEVKNSDVSWIGTGESYMKQINKDCNEPDCGLGSRAWVKNAEVVLVDSNVQLAYEGGNTGYYYVDNTSITVEGGMVEYLTSGGSNGRTNKASVYGIKAHIVNMQTVNRGFVEDASVDFVDCVIDNLYIGGDATDSTVTGSTKKFYYETTVGTYNIVNGFEKGVLMTPEDVANIVQYVKVSRSADVTIDDDTKALLGAKYIVK